MHRVTQNSIGEGGISYIDARKKVPERRCGLRPSEKERPERRTGAFRHKNTPCFLDS
jgi:hypothetical protein